MRLKTTARTMIDLLRDRAIAQPDDCAYTFLDDGERVGGSITWRRLDERSRAIGAAIARRVEPGARVLVMFPPSIEFVPAFLGVLYAGATALPAYPPAGTRADRMVARLRGMIVDAGVTLVLTPSVPASRGTGILDLVPELRDSLWLGTDSVLAATAREWQEPPSANGSLAFLQYTSGSTSSPRGVMVSHRNLLHNLARTHIDGGYAAGDVSLSWLPVNHDMGLINGVLQPVFSGCHAFLMAPAAFLQRPVRWLQAISRLGVTHSGGPNFAYDLCVRRVGEEAASTLELGSWRVAYNGSEPIRRSTLESFQRRFGARGFRWEAFCPAYGLAESTLLVAGVPAGAPPAFHEDVVASGILDGSSKVIIVDPHTRMRLADQTVGEIWLAGDSVALGYWNRPQETAETFRAYTTDGEGPFLRTGDLGFVRQSRLHVTGRIKDVLIVRGVKHYPQDLERTAEEAHPAVRTGCCAAFSIEAAGEEQVAIVAEVDPRARTAGAGLDITGMPGSIRSAVAERHQVAVASVTLVQPGTIPKTTSGKLQRFLCREALANGTLEAVLTWRAGNIHTRSLAEAPPERRRAEAPSERKRAS
jgi:acyl-CoA synthetase (AMP-forming)/AMP-acid ligase II